MSTPTPSGARTKVIPIMLPANVRSIRRRSVSVPAMTTTSNAIRLNGVPITGITLKPVRCLRLLTDSVRTASLIINNVKKTGRALVGKPDMSIHVLPDGFMPLQTAVSGTVPTASAVPLRPRPVVPPITKLLATLPAALPVPTLAAILVIAVVPMNVPEGQRTTAVLMLQQPNAGQLVVTVKTVLPEVPHIPVLMSDLPNAVTVIPVPIPAVPVRNPCLVPLLM